MTPELPAYYIEVVAVAVILFIVIAATAIVFLGWLNAGNRRR